MGYLRCSICNGSGRIMGGGMIYKDCYHCNGEGKILKGDVDIEDVKGSASYNDAIHKIMSSALDGSVSRKKAEEIFEEEFKRQKVEPKIIIKKKRGRPFKSEEKLD